MTAARLLLFASLMCLGVYPSRANGCINFLSVPQNVTVTAGSSASFFCIAANKSIAYWYFNNSKTVDSVLSNDDYVFWERCTRPEGYCGGTLFIKNVTEKLNGSTVACQVACNSETVIFSPSATIFVKSPVPNDGVHSSSSSDILSPSPSPSPPHDTEPSVFIEDTLKTNTKNTPVTEKLVQRVPLLAAAAGVCFILGGVFGAVCSVTIARGVKRCHKHKQRRRLLPMPAENISDPTYTELAPAASSTDSGVRRDNEYMELGSSEIPQAQGNNTPQSECCNGVTMTSSCIETVCTTSDEAPNSSDDAYSVRVILPPTPPDSQQSLQCSCIEVDLDELERAVLQQD